MNTVDRRWLDAASSRSGVPSEAHEPIWRHWLVVLHTPVWQVLLGAVCALALLTAFYQVVRDGVRQSELRHRVAATAADGAWRCNAERGARERANCQSLLKNNGAHHAGTPPQDPRGAAAMAVVHLGR
jgi:hypothetical protein